MERPPLLIVGASARAASWSARRAGYAPIALDRFADRDLFELATVIELSPGQSILEAIAALPRCNWMYTGGMENDADLVDAISEHHDLIGNPGRVLRQVRDPIAWTAALRDVSLPHLDVATRETGYDPRKPWICKPFRSVGGLGVAVRIGDEIPEGCFLQRRIGGGRLIGAQFRCDAAGVSLLGACEQWVGGPGSPGSFAYRGSLGPICLADGILTQVIQTAEVLTKTFGLTGLFGIDFLLDDRLAWPIEINPRYTASIEILERSGSCPVGCTLPTATSDFLNGYVQPDAMVGGAHPTGKCVLYAEKDLVWIDVETTGDMADIPSEGAGFHRGDPILTLFAQAKDLNAVGVVLGEKVEGWRSRLGFLT